MALTEEQITVMTQHEKDLALLDAASDGCTELVSTLINHEANPIKLHVHVVFWHNTLTIAIANNHMPVVLELLKNELVQKQAAAYNNLALFWAAKCGRKAMVQALLEIDQLKKTVNTNNNAALIGAAEKQHFQIVNMLLSLEVVKSSLTPEIQQLLKENGFFAWLEKRHSIILSIRAMSSGGMSFDIMLHILRDLYPENSEIIFRKQLKFVDELPKDMGRFMNSLALEGNDWKA